MKNNKRFASLLLALGFLGLLLVLTLAGRLPSYFLWSYALLSLVTFLVYAWDKSAAKRDAWRTQESSLHLLALCGGWPGALLASQLLRHKSLKLSFRLMFWLSVAANLLLLYALLYLTGTVNPA
ncbi:DUF1294 domain-containing protein [Shewanella salipaludis]|uniref:DUF1294 domain-containing protein n=1 Tax=Shewanella salipaludis TaxID=2723052 RepID=A0A972FUR8_9GAMM|nr:DUF1294 domain-containing protein [Shewanella salipaludis]NMH65689.1 DUF1294 domain-containing protein [Shewanella salipaludis]